MAAENSFPTLVAAEVLLAGLLERAQRRFLPSVPSIQRTWRFPWPAVQQPSCGFRPCCRQLEISWRKVEGTSWPRAEGRRLSTDCQQWKRDLPGVGAPLDAGLHLASDNSQLRAQHFSPADTQVLHEEHHRAGQVDWTRNAACSLLSAAIPWRRTSTVPECPAMPPCPTLDGKRGWRQRRRGGGSVWGGPAVTSILPPCFSQQLSDHTAFRSPSPSLSLSLSVPVCAAWKWSVRLPYHLPMWMCVESLWVWTIQWLRVIITLVLFVYDSISLAAWELNFRGRATLNEKNFRGRTPGPPGLLGVLPLKGGFLRHCLTLFDDLLGRNVSVLLWLFHFFAYRL